jgi:hypothetical protein
LIVYIFDRVLKFKPQAARLCNLTANGRLRRYKPRLRCLNGRLFDCDLHLKRLRIKSNQDIAFFYPVVIINQNLRDLPADARSDEGDIAVHVSIVSRNGVPRVKDPGDDDEDDEQYANDNERAARSKFLKDGI